MKTDIRVSRLRKGALTRAVVISVAASAPLVTAQAAIIYSGIVNTTTSSTTGPATVNINVDGAGANEFTMESVFGKGPLNDLKNLSSDFRFIAGNTTTFKATKLGAGFSVNSTDTFSDGSSSLNRAFIDSGNSTQSEWAASDNGYLGFKFNPTGSLTLYGWARFTMSGDNRTMTLVDYAYQNSATAILTGDTSAAAPVPEPSTAALGMLGLGLVAFLRQRRRGAVQA